jgi:hypothetical protein
MPLTLNKEVTLTKPILVCNKKAGPTVFSDASAGVEIHWAGMNDGNGDDIQPVPIAILENTDFIRALTKGALEVVDAPPEVLDALGEQLSNSHLARQAQSWKNRQDTQKEAVESTVSRLTTRDTLGLPCVGPGARGEACGELSPVLSQQVRDTPPLCSKHEHLKREFVPVEGEVQSNGKASITWKRASFQ